MSFFPLIKDAAKREEINKCNMHDSIRYISLSGRANVIMNFKKHAKVAANEHIHQNIFFNDNIYTIISAEEEFILHPAVLGMVDLSIDNLSCPFTCNYSIKDYHLMLDSFIINDTKNNECGHNLNLSDFSDVNQPVYYNGVVLIGYEPIKDFMIDDKPVCFSYKYVFELVFNKGMLETTIDHSKAMQRIRRNLALGLRNLDRKRDAACIRRFIKASMIGDYKPHRLKSLKLKYLKNMKKHNQKLKI